MVYHVPVLLNECIEGLKIKPDGIYADLTFGGGGHSAEILKQLKKGRLFAFDIDQDAEKNVPPDTKLIFIKHNFRFFKNFLRYYNAPKIDGIIADLGVSSHQFDDPERGFSYRFENELDMRMTKNYDLTAAEVLNKYEEKKLADIFYHFGEINNSRKLAASIEKRRKSIKIEKADQLFDIIKECIQGNQAKYLAKVYQALRIEVNQELENLKQMLIQVPGALKKEGRFVIITYHSLEDRLVKNFIKKGTFMENEELNMNKKNLELRQIHKKVIIPPDDEIRKNSRARSAKLRIAEKT